LIDDIDLKEIEDELERSNMPFFKGISKVPEMYKKKYRKEKNRKKEKSDIAHSIEAREGGRNV